MKRRDFIRITGLGALWLAAGGGARGDEIESAGDQKREFELSSIGNNS